MKWLCVMNKGLWLLILLLPALAGCGQSLLVKVERIQPEGLSDPGTTPVIDEERVQAIFQSIEAMQKYMTILRSLDAELARRNIAPTQSVRQQILGRIGEADQLLREGDDLVTRLAHTP